MDRAGGPEDFAQQPGEVVLVLLEFQQRGRERLEPARLDERLPREAHEPIQALRRHADDRLRLGRDRGRRGRGRGLGHLSLEGGADRQARRGDLPEGGVPRGRRLRFSAQFGDRRRTTRFLAQAAEPRFTGRPPASWGSSPDEEGRYARVSDADALGGGRSVPALPWRTAESRTTSRPPSASPAAWSNSGRDAECRPLDATARPRRGRRESLPRRDCSRLELRGQPVAQGRWSR